MLFFLCVCVWFGGVQRFLVLFLVIGFSIFVLLPSFSALFVFFLKVF